MGGNREGLGKKCWRFVILEVGLFCWCLISDEVRKIVKSFEKIYRFRKKFFEFILEGVFGFYVKGG